MLGARVFIKKVYQSVNRSFHNTSATTLLNNHRRETGAFRSSVNEINKSSSIVNFITHVWSCCSDLLIADWAFGPEGRQLILRNQYGFWSIRIDSIPSIEMLSIHLNKTKHVSVIDVDPCIEVRCWG